MVAKRGRTLGSFGLFTPFYVDGAPAVEEDTGAAGPGAAVAAPPPGIGAPPAAPGAPERGAAPPSAPGKAPPGAAPAALPAAPERGVAPPAPPAPAAPAAAPSPIVVGPHIRTTQTIGDPILMSRPEAAPLRELEAAEDALEKRLRE